MYATCYIKVCKCGKVVARKTVANREPVVTTVLCTMCAWKIRYAEKDARRAKEREAQRIKKAVRAKKAQHRFEKEQATKAEIAERRLQAKAIRERMKAQERQQALERIRAAVKASPERHLITPAEAGRVIGVSKRTVYYWMSRGKVAHGVLPSGSPGIYADSILPEEANV